MVLKLFLGHQKRISASRAPSWLRLGEDRATQVAPIQAKILPYYGHVETLQQPQAPIRQDFWPEYTALESTNISELIQIDQNFFSRLAIREEILATEPNTSVRANDAVQPAVNELYTFLVRTYLPKRFPTLFRLSATSYTLVNLVSGALYPLSPSSTATATLKTIGGLVDEDFMLLLPSPDGDGYSLQGYVVCFSSGFALDKIFGAKLRDIHAEVPRYREKLQASMDKWFERLQPGRYVRRANVNDIWLKKCSLRINCLQWTITMHGQLRNAAGENQLYTDDCNDDLEIENIDIAKVNRITLILHQPIPIYWFCSFLDASPYRATAPPPLAMLSCGGFFV